ncbi:type II toxin-antitoxin system RelE/ParE family toxin [Leptospira barantonii]|uniref:Type II toxin-antitoxin system RelE/ParE family toxin n=1 Tax=Leptospira barantonii TaxID=2023184 RepID=A0A5F2AYK8_9LEPT|nr:type II toxin-antitoxin system RelE/ParE family toxin [Leptospira barantonii]TGL93473.1 type II toxin-antitoxin system RelE/ParE family toxin [Leptospira barantonii]
MIRSFRSPETEKVWNQEFSKKLPNQIQKTAYRKLVMLSRSKHIDDLKIPPSNHLEKLSGNRSGQYSIRINDQWRICFRWKDTNAYDVEIVDYH